MAAMAALACMTTVAAIIANLAAVPLPSDTSSLSSYISGISSFIIPTAAGLWFIVLIGLLFQRKKLPKRAREEAGPRKTSPFAILILVGIIIVMVVLAQGRPASQDGTPDEWLPTIDPENDNTDPQLAPGGSLDPLTLVPLIAVLAMVALLSYRRMRTRDAIKVSSISYPSSHRDQVEQIMVTVSSGDVRGAIIEAYRQMYGMVRASLGGREALTPRELETELTQSFGWPSAPVRSLTRTFEEARYSDHPLGEESRGSALRDLETVRADLEAKP